MAAGTLPANEREHPREVAFDPTRDIGTTQRSPSQLRAGDDGVPLYCSSIIPLLFLYYSSIVPLLFLYCSSIAPLVLSVFAASTHGDFPPLTPRRAWSISTAFPWLAFSFPVQLLARGDPASQLFVRSIKDSG